ncbi:argininosuccinate lyase [Elizabethkingia meningoseptica]|uniref:Argininosuccinate lyase n=3 Tax=Elizabethkingia meningoseptica TaxID=238 RepID=A0A1V3TWF0_ELIME|nr:MULTISPECIES: argininosuccinate lyase [Elizabethkingia]AQX14220.1 argininosuccinate lyase [Elizabethkingia meningoseptica]MBG0513467.1 argininosuccinate lyase [Elizabethkingia meningoseptica]MDE5431631.1 argininosuccinate lyase [Elizabethkingia meningoseptica]MDE5434822.1 argininosuccinate lyase [Elizabethkingia meningoseptica]MDE5438218.1 argininosuccinate lyase [Elizabethkingia meningoseptica]
MKLWDKNIEGKEAEHAKIIEKFTVGNDRDFDLLLAEYDIKGNLAHAEMLSRVGLLERAEWELLEKELLAMLEEVKEGKFTIEDGVEDVHSQVEFSLTQRIGDVGKKIHSARSRNDQVLVDIKLYLKAEIKEIANLSEQLFTTLQSLSEAHKEKLIPGYTHLQIAMPSSFGLWFGAYAEALTDDLELLLAAYNVCNKNPLGSAAGYGSSFPIDREFTTEKLEFETLNYNVVYAQMTRGKAEKILAMAMANLAGTLSKFSYDVCLYMNQNFGFISFPDSLTTGSSIMPHKKNPDVFELVRAKSNRIQSLPNELTLMINNLPSGYHRDWQLTKEIIFPGIETLKDCLQILDFMLQHINVKDGILTDEKYKYLFSVEAVNKEVLNGLPFREAYKKIGLEIENNQFQANISVHHTHTGSIGNLATEKIRENFYKVFNKII